MLRELSFEKDARDKLIKGVEIMYKAVGTTLGPKGRNVAIAREWGMPIVVHDGVTVAREVFDKDEFVNMGINLVREAAVKTNDEAGDGTTTSTLLSYFIIKYGMELIDKGQNPMTIRKQLDEALPKLNEQLKKISVEVKSDEEVARVAKISSTDEEVGKLVSEAVKKIGRDGTITVEDNKDETTLLEYSEGLQIDNGWKNPYFITNPKTMEAVVENPMIVVLGKKITIVNEILPLLNVLVNQGKDIVLFGDIEGLALQVAIRNKMEGILNILVVDVPGYSDRRENLMNDIVTVTGSGKIVKDELGLGQAEFAKQFDLKWVGRAKKVIASRKKTVIIDGKGTKENVDERIKTIKAQIENEKNSFEVEKLKERLAKLTTGVAVIKVGAKTEIARREKEERVKDAVSAAQAAKEEGIVPGGGIAFLKLKEALISNDRIPNMGEEILLKALTEPIKKILHNAGEPDDKFESILKTVREKGGNFGYEMESGNIVDLVKEGIIDPAKVLRLALENAISVAGSILTTDCLIAIKKEKKDENS